ncbi:MAG TPA: amino acid adenylation domain-containing protein, partial [Herpetosiphonaceae bacterium]
MKGNFAERPGLSLEELELLALLMEEEGLQSEQEQAIRPRDPLIDPPLSLAQERLWFVDQWEQDNVSYNLPLAVRLAGRLDRAAMEWSINAIVERHEALRTTFPLAGDQPIQHVAPGLTLSLTLIDLQPLPAAEREAEALRLADAEAHQRFDLQHGPLLRIALLRLDADEHILLLNMHHMIFDGWSMGLFIREFSTLYTARVSAPQGTIPNVAELLPRLPIQYADFAIWQREWLSGAALHEELSFWQEQLHGPLPVLQLPTDRPRPPVQTSNGAVERVTLPETLTSALAALGQQEDATPFMVLLAAFNLLLGRYSRQDDIIVGSPIANRDRSAYENLMGYFVNTLLLRTDLSGNPTFRELLRRTRSMVLNAYAHQNVPFEQLVDVLRPERNPSYTPLFQAMFILQNLPIPSYRLPDLTLTPIEQESSTAKFDLTLNLAPPMIGASGAPARQGGLVGTLEYNTDLFDAATIRRMVGHFEMLLGAIARHPDRPIADLALATEAEQALLESWTSPLEPFDDAICVHELFARQAARTPDAIAVTQRTRDGSQRELSYGELDRRANQLARYLHGLGIGPESRVGLLVERSPEMIVGLLGVLKAGGAYVPLDPALPTERLAFMLEDARIEVLLTQSRLTAQIEQLGQPTIVLLDDWSPLAEMSSEPLPVAVHPTNLAYVIYTSGSTGRPKGVLTTHQSVVSYLEAVQPLYRLSAADRVLQFASLSFDASAEEIYGSLTSGATLVLRSDEMLASAGIFFAACRDWQLSVLSLPTAYWHELCAQLADDPIVLPSDLRLMIIGGERAQSARLAQWQQIAPQVQMLNTYGPTEATIVATAWEAEQPADVLRELPIGRPLRNVQGYILDQQLRRVPVGVPGELCLSGPALARGYLARPDVTAEKFIPDPFASHPGSRLYRTGDLARYLADGNIEFLGRIDDQVKLRGFRIEPGEIEAALLAHEAVREAAVMARDDQLVAYVVLKENQEPRTKNQGDEPDGSRSPGGHPVLGSTSSESLASILRAFLSSRLPAYMVPSTFVLLDALPLTASGKLDRRTLPAPARQTATDSAYAPPTTPLEQTIAAIWQQVLHIEQAGIHDNFFDLGGHSLRLLQVQNQIRTQLEREVLLPELFRRPTIHELAQYLVAIDPDAGEMASPLPPITRQPRTTNQFPLSFAQQRLWFLDQLQMDDSSYNIPLALRLTGQLDVAALERCYQAIVARHESLRTTFAIPRAGAEPVQVIHPFQPQPLPLHDLGDLPATEREPEALRRTVAEASQPFDLAVGPLVRAQLLRLTPTEHLLLVTLHHTIADGWSLGVLVQELIALYTAKPGIDPLPELPIQYADYAVWQRDWMSGAIYHQQLDYWRQQLAPRDDSLPLLQLPTDRPHPSIYTTHGASLRRALPQPLADALRDLSAQHGATLFMTLLAGFYTLLYRYTGQTDLIVGSPIAGRRQAESENLIGFFVNTLALRTQVQGELRFDELLQRVHETALGAYAHQDLPFELLVEELRIERITNRTPIFQVLFVLQNTPLPVLALPDLTIRPVEAANNTAKFDLTVQIFEDHGALLGDFEYNTDIFEAATIERLIDHWQTLLSSIVAAPAQRLDDLALLPPAEQQLLLHDWNATAAPYPTDALVHHVFERQVERTPDAEAALMIDGARVVEALSYAELNARANQLARYLRDLGVGPDQPVGLFLPRSLDLLIAVLASLKAGGAYLPLDPTYPTERLQFMLANAGAPVVLTHAARRDRIQPAESTSSARIVCLDHEQARIDQQPQHNLVDTAGPENLTYVIYTSGSTGQPKGVAMPHRALINLMTWQLEKTVLREPVRTLQFAPISFDASFQELFTAWGCGDALVMLPDEQRRDTPVLLEILRKHRIGRLFLPFVALQQIAETAITLDLIPDSLREIMTAGEQLQTTRSLVTLFQRLPHCTLHNQYGPSEAHVVTHYTLSEQPNTWTALPPIGRPIANTQLYLLDRQLHPVPLGVVGDLYLGGENLARGYQQRPDLTAERFIPDSFGAKAGSRLYATGDLARYLPDGNVEFLGRRDAQLKIRGYRIELGEIEAVLGQHPEVQAAVVVPHRRVLPDGLTHDTRLVAYVVPQEEQTNKRTNEQTENQESRTKNQEDESFPSPIALGAGHTLTPDAVLTFLQQRLPDYLVPGACLLLDALPRTPSGKIDRKALPDPEAAFQSSASYVPPS